MIKKPRSMINVVRRWLRWVNPQRISKDDKYENNSIITRSGRSSKYVINAIY